jgi:serine/threonine-protein kinase
MPPWHRGTEVTAHTSRAVTIFFLVVLVVLVAIVLLARRNIRLERGDIRAATRLGTAAAITCFAAWLVGAHHVASFFEAVLGIEALAWAALYAIVTALGYLAIEPAMRRRRPQALVSWTRLIAGEVRDPLVGRDLLVGAFAGSVAIAAFSGALAFSGMAHVESRVGLPALNGSNVLLAELMSIPTRAVLDVVLPLMLLLLLRAIVRKDILAAFLLGAIYVAAFANAGGNLMLPAAVEITLTLFVLMRFGFLATAVMNSVEAVLLIAPSIWPPEQWHTGLTLIAAAVVVLIAGYGFVTSLAGRPLIAGDLIEA